MEKREQDILNKIEEKTRDVQVPESLEPGQIEKLLEEKGEPPCPHGARLIDLLRRPRLSYADLAPFGPARPELPQSVAEQVEISVKYEGYIQRQLEEVEAVAITVSGRQMNYRSHQILTPADVEPWEEQQNT